MGRKPPWFRPDAPSPADHLMRLVPGKGNGGLML